MKKIAAIMLSVGLLGGCATAIEGQTQPITILTPGADDAECYLSNKDIHYVVKPGQMRKITKSERDLTIECLASGNRERTVIVDSQLEPAALLNVTNGVVPGTAYDHFSKGLYAYPEEITVDFTNVDAKPYPQPDYMNPRLRKAFSGELENYGSSTPFSPSDAYDMPGVIQKRTGNISAGNPFESSNSSGDYSSGGTATGTPSPAPLIPITEK